MTLAGPLQGRDPFEAAVVIAAGGGKGISLQHAIVAR
jgi:hypothetical protein